MWKKRIFYFLSVIFFSIPIFSQDFYWENPVTVSAGEGQFPKSISNGTDSYAFWQEIDEKEKKIYLSVLRKDSGKNWKANAKFAGPFTFSGEIPDLYSAAISSTGRVVVVALSSEQNISAFVSDDKCNSFRKVDFPYQNGQFIAPRVFVTESDSFYLFCSLARQKNVGNSSSITTHNFYLYGSISKDGFEWSNFEQLFEEEKYRNSFSPFLASCGTGDFLVFQTQVQNKNVVTYQLYESFSKDDGITWSDPILISGENSFEEKQGDFLNFDNQLPFAYVYDEAVHVVWERNSPGSDNSSICYARINENGVVPRSAETVSDGGNSRRAVLFSVEDSIYASWYGRSSGKDCVFYARKDGFDWKKEIVETGKVPCKNPYPVLDGEMISFIWQENYSGAKNRIRFLGPDSTCAKAGISAEKYKSGTKTKNQKVKFRISLPPDSSGIDGYAYSWSKDESVVPVLDEHDIRLANNTILNLTAGEEGDWYLKVCALDKAGNWSDVSSFKYSLDLTPPQPVLFEDVLLDKAGFVKNNGFTLKWNPAQSDDDIVGYNFTLEKIAGISKKYSSTPKHPLNLNKSDAVGYVSSLMEANRKAIERDRKLSNVIKTKGRSKFYRNLDNGLYVMFVSAIDEAGHVGKSASIPLVINKYSPLTQILKITKEESVFGDVKIDIFGRDFLVDGVVSKIIVDGDGVAPYDYEFDSSGGFKVVSNVKISGINLGSEIDEGSYFVGVVHTDRGVCMTQKPALNITVNGTVKIENDYDYQPVWRAVSKTYKFKVYIGGILLLIVLVLAAIGMLVFGLEFIKNCGELFSNKRLIDQLSKGVLMDAVLAENKKRKGTLKVSLSGFTISLVIFIIVLLSMILGYQMIREKNKTLATGLHDRVNVLLSSLATGTRSYLPSEDILELSQLPRQMGSLEEAKFVTITGFPGTDGKVKNSESILHVWASNDSNINGKIDVLNSRHTSFDPGVSLISRNNESEEAVLEKCAELNDEAVRICGETVNQLVALSGESLKANTIKKQEINAQMQNLNIQLNNQLNELSAKAAGSIPAYSDTNLNREITEYLFYRPVLFRAGQSKKFVRGIVFIKVDISTLIEEVDASTRMVFYSVVIIATFAILMGIIAAVIFATKMVKPISRLEKVVKDISEENNKELLLRNEIKDLPNNEIGRLGESVNRMQRDLGINARELNLQLNASEIQQGLVPLEPLAGNVKQNVSKINDDKVNEFAYYKGAAGVSGDYFDFKKLDDRFYVMVKCDASGHAAPAGILVTIIATLYKEWTESWNFSKDGTKLEQFVYKANDFLESLNIKGKFVAMIICLYDSKTGNVYMCHAGDKIYRIFDSKTRKLVRNELNETPAVGPFPSFMVEMKGGFTVEKTALKSKDILLLYTDGIEENGRAKRKADFSAIMKPKLNSEGEQIKDDYGNLEWEIDKEEFGEERVHDIFESVVEKRKYLLTKEHNPSAGERLEFDFSNCQGTVEECICALASAEKIFRMYKPYSASAKDWVEVDVAIDRFLQDHFNLYKQYAIQPNDENGEIIKPKNPNYVYYAYCKEDVQEDDLTLIAMQNNK